MKRHITSKKFKKFVALLSVAASLFITSVSSVNATPHLTVNAASSAPSISCQGHVQDIGWQGVVTSGVGISSTVGTEGRSLRLEDLKLRLNNASGGIKISTHISCIGWLGYSSASSGYWAESGTTGRSLAIEAVKIELYGSIASSYNIVYRVHSQNIGWGNWVQNGEEAGTTGRGLRAEAIGIKLVAKSNVTTTYYVKTNGGNLTVRSGPSTGYTSLGKLSNGTAVSVYSISNGWAKIKFGSGTGYVSAAYLSKTKPDNNNTTSYCKPVSVNSAYFRSKSDDNGWFGYHDVNGVSIGTSVYAIADGTAQFRQSYRTDSSGKYLTSYGNSIKFTSSDGKTTAIYAHLNSFNGVSQEIPSTRTKAESGGTVMVIASRRVSAGDLIGYVGTTGNSTGAHLHFELRINGTRVDPTEYVDIPGK